MRRFYSNGKLLITGEYVVLDGALSLALPTKFGQSLEVTKSEKHGVEWKALDNENKVWLSCFFDLDEIMNNKMIHGSRLSERSSEEIQLLKILHLAYSFNNKIFHQNSGYQVKTKLDFPKIWGLGTSATLINNIAQWFQVDPYFLLERSFGGSGYDIAAAQNNQPITYQYSDNKRSVLKLSFDPVFKDELFFVHLNRKQNSRDSIAHYKKQPKAELDSEIKKISGLTSQMIACESIVEFKLLLEIHETIISKLINTPKVKTELFSDFPGAIKSLGGWGGDFILATGTKLEMNYFKEKAYHTIVPFSEMVL
tara:strand:+ start:70376 stop:71305 length:930 start_codon:yes stop_codon:yes gene_type:complete